MRCPLIDWTNTIEEIILKFKLYIPSTAGDEVLEDKVIEIFECLNIPLAKSGIEGCHRLGKSTPKSTIVRFVNRKNCYAALSKKLDLQHINKVKLGFPEANLCFNENLTPYNQKLAWKCREIKCAGKIHSTWSTKGVIKLRCTMNEPAISIEGEIELSDLYPDFVFCERHKQGRK